MNLLISIGCNKYDFLSPLAYAEADATALHDLLTAAGDPYSIDHATLLLSPTTDQVRQSLAQAFPLKSGYDSVTLIFAGHGVTAAGSFFLCMRDSRRDNFSTTAISISSLFTIFNEFKPVQVNLVIDACNAGGSSLDLGALIRSEVTGSSSASSIAFLGACGTDQYASEQSGHGFLTAHVLRILRGEMEVQRRGQFLDLLEIGTVVSTQVQAANADQRPLAWGLNLFGGSRFAKNPFYSVQTGAPFFPLPDIFPYSHFGTKIREMSGELWEIHRELPQQFSPRRLLTCLSTVLPETESSQERVVLVKGLGASLSSRARDSEDLLSPWLCLATCIVSLLPHANQADIERHLPELILSLLDRDPPLYTSIRESIEKDEYYLLSHYAVAGDLYYLPLRISRLLGWVGLDILGRRLLGADEPFPSSGRDLIEILLLRYGQSLSAVSDAQGAPLYILLLACALNGWDDIAKEVLTTIYASFCERKGNTTRWDVPVEQAVRYVLSLTESALTPKDWRPANPSHLLPVLLAWGDHFGLTANWDLRALDRLSMNFFIPKDPRDFSMKVMEHGMNRVYQIGFGIWKIEAFLKEYRQALSVVKSDGAFNLLPTTKFQCLLSSFLFPDRIAYFLDAESITPHS